MMAVKDIVGLSVETRSGERIGSVAGVSLDPTTHTVVQYEVRPPFLKGGPFRPHRLIAPKQVVSIDEQKMVVEDLIVFATEKATSTEAAAFGS